MICKIYHIGSRSDSTGLVGYESFDDFDNDLPIFRKYKLLDKNNAKNLGQGEEVLLMREENRRVIKETRALIKEYEERAWME